MGIPWSVGYCPEYLVAICGQTMRAYHGDPAVQIEVQLGGPRLLHERFGLPLSRYLHPDFSTYITGSPFGLTFEVFEDGVPSPPGHPIGSIEEAAALRVPEDRSTVGYYPEALRFHEYMKRHAPEGVGVGFGYGGQGPFTTAVLLRGESFLVDLLDQPALCHRFLQTLTDSAIRQREFGREVTGDTAPVEVIGYTDDYGGLVGPELFAEFNLPYLEQIAERFGSPRRTIHAELLHQPHLVMLQDHGWEYIDVGTDPHLTITKCREALHIPFRVDFDNTGVMLLGTPEEVKQRYREMVEEGAPEMKVDLCRGHRDENIAAWVEVAHAYE